MNCDPNELSRLTTCFHCLPDPKAVKTYLLCQWAGKPSCTPPVFIQVSASGVDATTIQVFWIMDRDPLLNFTVSFGQNAGGPYNDPQSPITVAKNLRTLIIAGLITGNSYFGIVTAIDSLNPPCQSVSIEWGATPEG